MARETDSLALVCCKDAEFVAGAFRDSGTYLELLAKLRARLKCEFVRLRRAGLGRVPE